MSKSTKPALTAPSDYHKSVRGLRFLVRAYYDVQAARQTASSRTLPAATEDAVGSDV